MPNDYQSFNEFAREDCQMVGEKKKLDCVLNKKILITNFRLNKSHYKDSNYLTIQYKLDGNTYITFTGSEVLAKQLEKYKDKLPFYATVVKIGKYYSLS